MENRNEIVLELQNQKLQGENQALLKLLEVYRTELHQCEDCDVYFAKINVAEEAYANRNK